MTNQLVAKGEAPQGWVWARLGDIVEFEYGKGLRKDRRDIGGRVPVYGSNGILGYHSDSLVRYPCVVIGRKGAIGQVHLSKTPCWPIDTTYYVCPPDCISLAFSYLLLCYLRLGSLDRSTAIPGLNRDDAYRLAILVPPLAEQDRIVARIEELLTRLDAGVEALTRIKAHLKRYRQAVLKHAFEGKLTAEWREAHKHELEPSWVLLERIKQERQKNTKGKCRESPARDGLSLPGLREGWVWAVLGDIAEVNLGRTPRKTQYAGEGSLKIVKFRDIVGNGIDWDRHDRGFVFDSEGVVSRLSELRRGDVLVTASAHSSEHIGKKVVYVRTIPERYRKVFFVGELICVRVYEDTANPRIVYHYLSSQDGYKAIQNHVRGVHLIASEARLIGVPLPRLAEQDRMVEEIERRFSVADQIEKTVDQGLKQAERLRQSILKRAFEGKLVPQDPNDEPAEILLERIREERASLQAGAKSKKTTRKRTATQEMRLM